MEVSQLTDYGVERTDLTYPKKIESVQDEFDLVADALDIDEIQFSPLNAEDGCPDEDDEFSFHPVIEDANQNGAFLSGMSSPQVATGDEGVQSEVLPPVSKPVTDEVVTVDEGLQPEVLPPVHVSKPVTDEACSAAPEPNGLVCTPREEQGGTALESVPDTDHDSSALQAAQAEWDAVQTVEAGFADEEHPGKDVVVSTTPLIAFNEALQHFQNCDLIQYKSEINMNVQRHGFSALKHLLFGPPKLNKALQAEKEMIFCMAAAGLDNSNDIHLRTLQTIYRTLTGSKFDCPRFGGHYEEIGFQGTDPSTDLRGTGLLGLMHILYLLSDTRTLSLARDIYKLSLDETQNFPFCLMGINISRITLQALREDSLNRESNRRKQVIGVMNDFYVGTYLHLYQIWKTQYKTIADSGFVIKDVENFVKKNPKTVIRNLENYLLQKSQSPGISAVEQSDNFVGFSDLNS